SLDLDPAFHQLGIFPDRVDDLDLHALDLASAQHVEIDIGAVGGLDPRDRLGPGEYRIGDLFRCRSAVAGIVLDAEVLLRTRGIVTRRQDDAAGPRVFAN